MLKEFALWLFALLFIAAGINHFVHPAFYLSIMPAYLPAHAMLVVISGVFEILGGIGLMIKRTRKLAGIAVILLMIAIFPANLYMAMEPEQFPQFSMLSLYLRLPLQFALIAWVWWVSSDPQDSSN
ncbi:MAG: DoxX family protein [Gammaproteobacteria bacterium]|nr:DoxX family protein [Gammaproteobacteria bacterium]